MKHFDIEKYIVEPSNKIAKRVIYHDKNITAFVLNIAVGEALPNHTHFDCTVLVQVIKGAGTIIVDENRTEVSEGALLQVDGQENMGIENTGYETLVVYVTLSPLPPTEKYYVDVDI